MSILSDIIEEDTKLLDERRKSSVNILGPESSEEYNMAREKADKESAFTMDRVFNENFARSAFESIDRAYKYETDPNFDVRKHINTLSETIPKEYIDQFSSVTSEAEMMDLHENITHKLENRQLLGKMGWRGTTAQLLGTMLDADAILMLAPGGTYAGLKIARVLASAGIVGKTASLITGAAIGAEAAAIAEVGSALTNPIYDVENAPLAVLGGVYFGTGIGAITRMDKLATKSMQDASKMKINLKEQESVVTDRSINRDITTAAMVDEGSIGAAAAKPTPKVDFGDEGSQAIFDQAQAYLRNTDVVGRRSSELDDPNRGAIKKFVGTIHEATQHIPGMETGFNRLFKSKSKIATWLGHALYSDPSGVFRNVHAGAKIDRAYQSQILGLALKNERTHAAKFMQTHAMPNTNESVDGFRRLVANELDDRRYGRKNPDATIDPAVTAMADELDRGFATGLDILKGREGETSVWGSENLTHESGWRPFRWTYKNMTKTMKDGNIPEEAITNTLAKAYIDMNPNWSKKASKNTAFALVRRMKSLDSGGDMNLIAILRDEGEAHVREFLTESGIPAKEVETMIDGLKGIGRQKERGKLATLKHRNEIDPRTPIEGTSYTLADLMDNDVAATLHSYSRSAAGTAAMARHGIQKIDRSSIRKAAEKELRAEGVHQLEVDATLKDIDDLFQAFSGGAFGGGLNPWVRRALLITNLALLSSLGMVQAAETGVVVAAFGLDTFMKTAPQAIKTTMMKGEYSPAMKQIGESAHYIFGEHMLTKPHHNLDLFKKTDSVNEEAMRWVDKLGTGLDKALIKGQHIQGYLSGFYKIRQLQQDIVARAYMQKIGKLAKGEIKIDAERLYDMGLGGKLETHRVLNSLFHNDPEVFRTLLDKSGLSNKGNLEVTALLDSLSVKERNTLNIMLDSMGYSNKKTLDNILENFQKHVEYKDGMVHNLHPEKWHPDDWEAFNLSHIEVSDQLVQRALKGEDSPLLHHDVGAILGHLKSFPLLAMPKQLIRHARIGDTEAKMAFMYSLMFGGMVYSAKQVAAGRTENLTPERIARGAFGLANLTSPIPMMVDPLGAMLGINSLNISGYSRLGPAGTSVLPGIPAYNTLERMAHIPESALSLLTGNYNKQDITSMQSTPIVGNLYGFSAMFNSMKKDLTRKRQKERREQKKLKQQTEQETKQEVTTSGQGTTKPVKIKSLGQTIDKAVEITGGGE